MSVLTVAQFETRCGRCESVIRIGSEIELGGNGRWLHSSCPVGVMDTPPAEQMCGECFTPRALNGACLCGAL
jgi:hypothetical protein